MCWNKTYNCPKCGSARIPGEDVVEDKDPENQRKTRKFIRIDYCCGTHLKLHKLNNNYKYHWFWVCQKDVTKKQ